MKINIKDLLSTSKALQYVNALRAENGLPPFPYRTLLRQFLKLGIDPIRRNTNGESMWKKKDLHLVANDGQVQAMLNGYTRVQDLLSDVNKIRKQQGRPSLTAKAITHVLQRKNCPKIKLQLLVERGIANYYHCETALDIVANLKHRNSVKYNHIVAPPEILADKNWVTCNKAARICNCSTAEISNRASKYIIKSYVSPENKLLVNWKECYENMKWRTPRFIIKHLGYLSYKIIQRTCPCKKDRFGFTKLYYVPELTSFRKNNP